MQLHFLNNFTIGWGAVGQQLYSRNVHRLWKYNIIAAVASTGEVWYAVNNGYNNAATVWYFIVSLCLRLQKMDPCWRDNTFLYMGNAG